MSNEDAIRELIQMTSSGHPTAVFELVAMCICPRCEARTLDFDANRRSVARSLTIVCRKCGRSALPPLRDVREQPQPGQPVIQADLVRLAVYRQMDRQAWLLKEKIQDQLLSGAPVESGFLTAKLQTSTRQILSWPEIQRHCDWNVENRLRKDIPASTQQSVVLGIS